MAENQPTSQRQLPVGTQLRNGDYQIVRMIGQGGFGITYLAQHRIFGPVALKELFLNSGATFCSRESTTRQQVIPHFEHSQFELFKKRFEEEARTLYNLKDIKGVVKVQEIFEENDTIYFSMEYLTGEKLEDYIKRRGRLQEEDGLRIVKSLGRTLNEIHHRSVLHRDVKPANVIIGASGQVTLIDFGIARSYVDEITETHTTFHSPRYAPPEQKIANAKLGAYSDVFALGATTYFIFTGTAPQSIEERITENFISPKQLIPSLSAYIDEAITRSLALKKEVRFQTVKDFLAALQISSEPTQSGLMGATTSENSNLTSVDGATMILPEEKWSPKAEEHTEVEARDRLTSDESTRIIPTPNHKASESDENTLIIPPPKPIVQRNIWIWLVPVLLMLGLGAYYIAIRPKKKADPSTVDKPVSKPVETVGANPVLPQQTLIENPTEEDTQKFDKNKKRIEKKLLGHWRSPGGTSTLKLESTYTGKFGPVLVIWTIQPMKGGVSLNLEAAQSDTLQWRFIIAEDADHPNAPLEIKLHNGPETPFTTAQNMAVFTRTN